MPPIPLMVVVTTIQPPTSCMRRLSKTLERFDAPLIVIGDKKGPAAFQLPGADFLSLDAQMKLPGRLAKLLPTGSYARKNIGYLQAIGRGAGCIYETDDDNHPLEHWQPRALTADAQTVKPRPWMNVYRVFSGVNIWPRGFPLEAIAQPGVTEHDPATKPSASDAPIQQGLANGSPDVDAVWRLTLEQSVEFRAAPSVRLPPGTWCPFNSQSTWWWPPAFALMYLPSYCTMRMTDIWRSFVAQRCLWEFAPGLVFHSGEAFQERNVHRLLSDFQDEIPGYLGNQKITTLLASLKLKSGVEHAADNLRTCYASLVDAGHLPEKELPLVEAWVEDLAEATSRA